MGALLINIQNISICVWPVDVSHPIDSTMLPTNFYMTLFGSPLICSHPLNTPGNEEVVAAEHGVGLSVERGVLELLRAEVMHEVVEERVNRWWNSH